MDSNTILEDLFSSEVLRWRYFKALSISYLLQLLVSIFVCSTINTLIYEVTWNPLMWFYYLLTGVIKPYWLLKVVLPTGCYIVLARVHVHSYAVSWWVPERRWQYISQFFHLRKLLYSLALTVATTLLVQYYNSLVHPDFSSLTKPCSNSDQTCINHQAILILVLGVVFGFRLSCKYFHHNHRTICFPLAQPNFITRLKSKLKLRTIIESFALFNIGIGFFISVYLTYLLLGGMICQWLGPFLGVTSPQESYSVWPIVSMLLDVRFILTTTFCLGLLAYNLHTFFMIFQETITERIDLPLSTDDLPHMTPDTQAMSAWTLGNGLQSSSDLLKLFAYRHLKDVALDQTLWGQNYRARIFSISQPGGHPRNWQSIVVPSLNLIRKFCDRLKEQNCLEEKPPAPQKTSFLSLHKTDLNKNDLKKDESSFRRRWEQAKESFRQFPVFCYLLSELPNSKNRQIFAESQSVIWAVEGLSNLVGTSYSDDRYGVVQRNVADIVTALIQLQMVVEKVGRSLPYRKGTQGTNFGAKIQKYPNDLQLRRSLRLTLRSSLYIITNTFKESIREIHVTEDVRTKLESYLAFQEG